MVYRPLEPIAVRAPFEEGALTGLRIIATIVKIRESPLFSEWARGFDRNLSAASPFRIA